MSLTLNHGVHCIIASSISLMKTFIIPQFSQPWPLPETLPTALHSACYMPSSFIATIASLAPSGGFFCLLKTYGCDKTWYYWLFRIHLSSCNGRLWVYVHPLAVEDQGLLIRISITYYNTLPLINLELNWLPIKESHIRWYVLIFNSTDVPQSLCYPYFLIQ